MAVERSTSASEPVDHHLFSSFGGMTFQEDLKLFWPGAEA
jgi:hypothetical protein